MTVNERASSSATRAVERLARRRRARPMDVRPAPYTHAISMAARSAAISCAHAEDVRASVDMAVELLAHGRPLADVVEAVWRRGYRAVPAADTGRSAAAVERDATLARVVALQASGTPLPAVLAEIWRCGYRAAFTASAARSTAEDLAEAA